MNKTEAKKSLGLPREVRHGRTKWGQNFLKDKGILKKIADFAQIGKEDTVVEVGPGEGSLTEFLLERAGRVIAVEKDEKLVAFLREKFKKEIKKGELKIIEGDILEIEKISSPQAQKCTDIFLLENSSCSAQSASQGIFELADSKFFLANKYVLVGNIPYYITGAIFKKFLESNNQPKSITFVVQKEVAERIVAQDGKESILSISIKAYGKPEFGGVIKAGSFYPRPKVDSATISIRDISKKKFQIAQQESSSSKSPRASSLRSARLFSEDFPAGHNDNFEQKFFEILKKGFAHKRKLLIKNLLALSKSNVEIFKKCGIPEKTRAEDLKVENWLCLARELT